MKKRVRKNHKGKLTVIAGPMFSGKTTKLLTLFSVLSNLGYSTLCFKAEAVSNGGMGHTKSHDERSLPVIYIDMNKPKKILNYVGKQGIKKVIVDNINFFPKKEFIGIVKNLLHQGIDVYVNGLIYDYRKKEYGATKILMKMADETIELFAICVKCGGKADHTERIAGGTEQSVGTTGKVVAKYVAVCACCHKLYTG
ncbi:MAG: Thymidine kinase [Candidatus Gottesmanbacteria bacterium GW2011_GWB1_49_7]|uniref:Thymidine kinase n=1 Tax=Candidatus Gottesmanbacteria bacterium GW2011_GWB1_49_7 TaxID=1618448 RepID=A0A0G1VYK8_9BACT|nr:MAG: Thymidine kinase [Candidatus Gottesmanbacteria bacterium GW2011_GWB1_49_7]